MILTPLNVLKWNWFCPRNCFNLKLDFGTFVSRINLCVEFIVQFTFYMNTFKHWSPYIQFYKINLCKWNQMFGIMVGFSNLTNSQWIQTCKHNLNHFLHPKYPLISNTIKNQIPNSFSKPYMQIILWGR